MTLVLLRHGETPLNVTRVLQPADTPLSSNGRAQALALAARLARRPLAGLVSSDLPRALQTAQAIAAATGLAIETSALLQERNFGELRGRPYDTLGYDPIASEDEPPGGESGPVFRARVARAFGWILARQEALRGTLAVVSHGLVIHTMLAHHARLASAQRLPARISNASLSEIEVVPPHAAILVDCTAHLTADAGENPESLSGG
jgi:broad specificity phosphatase PhoE